VRNIYDIISEQKSEIDSKIISYELDFFNIDYINNQYIQEGFGDNIKEAGKKVIEFIKTIIAKIKEMVRKMIDFLTGKNSPSKRADALKKQIDEDLKNLRDKNERIRKMADDIEYTTTEIKYSWEFKGSEKAPKGTYYDDKMFEGQDLTKLDTEDYLKASKRTVNMMKYIHFDEKKDITKNFMDAVYATTGNYLQDYNVVNDLFVKSIEKTCFKGAGKRAKGSIIDRLKLELNEGSEPEQVKISEINYGIMVSYLSEDEINVFLKTVDNTATKALNDLKSKLERLQNSGNSEVSQKDFNNVQQVVNMVGTFMQYISSNVLKAHKVFTTILIQTLMDFHSTYC
jgi:ElaB/YqjD/DUF883 family membrane-anchored ribosome-binding protein